MKKNLNPGAKEITMIVTKKYIHDLREKSFLKISEDMEKVILEEFGKAQAQDEDGRIYDYTEQDIWEHIRTMIQNK